jgi:hypothetical protein
LVNLVNSSITPIERFEKALLSAGCRHDTRSNGRDHRWTCPAHEDHNPSLDVRAGDDGRVLFTCRAGCSQNGVLAALDLEKSHLFPRNLRDSGAQPGGQRRDSADLSPNRGEKRGDSERGGLTLQAYAEAKCLDVGFLETLGIREVRYFGAPALEIPFYGPNGEPATKRYRLHLEKGAEGDDRFQWKKGSRSLLYGLWRLDHARDAGYVVLVEGESDCHTLWCHDVPALGIPGASNWRHEWSEHLDGIANVYGVVEPDKGGETLAGALSAAPFADRLRLVRLEGAKDPSELHLKMCEEGGFADAWDVALEAAVPVADALRQAREERAAESWAGCRDLANRPLVLDDFADDLRRLGVVGEERAAKLVYLAVVSRLLDHPVSVAVKGPSAAGKSYTTTTALRFFPERAFYRLSGMSDRFLAYDAEPVAHRMIVVAEAAGLGETGAYVVRTLLSEGRLDWGTVEKAGNGLQARRIVKEGPCGLVITTTAVRLHPENETRLLSLPVNDTREQTERILDSLAAAAEQTSEQPTPDFATWHALSDWLECGECRVVIPFAAQLARAIPAVAVRQRRDFGQLLTLVQAHALLHRESRERDGGGRVVATLEDYAVVHALVADLFGEAAGTEVSATVRETVGAVTALLEAKPAESEEPATVAVVDVAKRLKLDKTAALRRVRTATQAGYLENLESRKGRPSRLILGESLPERLELLPSLERLQTGARGAMPIGDREPIEWTGEAVAW